MPLLPETIAALRARGVGYICCMCERMHHGMDKGLDRCTGSLECRGPIGNGDFPEYQGPLTGDMMANACFVCGGPARLRLEPKSVGLVRTLGLCESDAGLLKELKPKVPSNGARG